MSMDSHTSLEREYMDKELNWWLGFSVGFIAGAFNAILIIILFLMKS